MEAMETMETLVDALKRQSLERPDKVFLIHKYKKFSYLDSWHIVNSIALFIEHSGIVAGDKIGIMLPRSAELVFCYLAAMMLCVKPAPVNYYLNKSAQIDYINDLKPKGIITSEEILSPQLSAHLKGMDLSFYIDTSNKMPEWTYWVDILSDFNGTSTFNDIYADDIAYINYTTGSSGHPKGGLASHANIYWNTQSAINLFDIGEHDVHLCMFSSIAHPHELFVRALYSGGTSVLLEEINPKTILNTIIKYFVSCIMGLAPMYQLMASYCDNSQGLENLRIVESGGMYTSPEINKMFKDKFGLPILSVWGSTETTGIALANCPENYLVDGAMGKVCPYYQVKLVNDDMELVNQGEVGELLFKGPGLISGYEGNIELKRSNDWYCSGDMAKEDTDGNYYFVERKSGMIKVAGMKVYPLQVEIELLKHPMIDEAAVIGVYNKRKGAVPKAFIVTRKEAILSETELRQYINKKLPLYMVPKQFEFFKSLPKIGSGKIDKRALLSLHNTQRMCWYESCSC